MRISDPKKIKREQNQAILQIKHNGKIVVFITEKHVWKTDGYSVEFVKEI